MSLLLFFDALSLQKQDIYRSFLLNFNFFLYYLLIIIVNIILQGLWQKHHLLSRGSIKI